MAADIHEVRRAKLRKLVSDHEGMNSLARRLGLTKGAYISQLLTNPPHRDMSEKTARKWEKILGLAQGWFDGSGKNGGPVLAQPTNTDLLAQTLTAVTDALRDAKVTLPAAQVSELVAMHYTDALTTGKVDHDRIAKIVSLLKR